MFRNMNLTLHFAPSEELKWRWYFSSVHAVNKEDSQPQKKK